MLVLAFALVACAIWYERSRPRSQVVALVAALAAIAAAGRVAFAPIPNVTPTTDIALLSGYALGGAPGFMVGSLAALVSNLWLGQGPWTPWQMVGWGLTGVFGAGLAWATGRRLGRWGLAVACGLAGLAYGVLLDFSAMVIFGGEVSLERYLALSARGIPFNLAHAAGNFALALAAGPAIVDLLRRHRERFAFAWRSSAGPTLVIVAAVGISALLAGSLGFGSSPDRARAEGTEASDSAPLGARSASVRRSQDRAVTWLKRRQLRNGGFGSSASSEASPEMTGWAALGFAAARVNPLDVGRRSNPIAYLRRNRSEIDSSGDIERTILAVASARLDPATFAAARLVKRLAKRQRSDGSVEGQVNLTAFYVLAMDVADRPTRRAAAWLTSAQGDAGGWGYTPAARPDPDSTGAALQALAAAGRSPRARSRGTAWLGAQQRRDGGWAAAGGPRSNSQSTAWAVQGLVAAGVNPRRVTEAGRSGLDYLRARQARDGHYRYSASSDQTPVWVTSQVLAAIASEPYPVVAPPAERSSRAGDGSRVNSRSGPSAAPDAGVAGTDTDVKGSSPGGDGGGDSSSADDEGRGGAVPGGQDPGPGPDDQAEASDSTDGGSAARGLAIGLGLVVLALAGMGAARLARSRGWL